MYPREAIDFERHPMPRASMARIRMKEAELRGCAEARPSSRMAAAGFASQLPETGPDKLPALNPAAGVTPGPHIHQALPEPKP